MYDSNSTDDMALPLRSASLSIPRSTYIQDLVVVGAMGAMTLLIRTCSRRYFERNILEWHKLTKDIQSRMSVEIAAIPARLMLMYFTLPIVAKGFQSVEAWRAEDTEASIRACEVLTGTYIIDLTVTRNDKGSTLHHCMGPALLLWIRTCFSTFTSSDGLLCRLLMSFIFFGGTISGGTTTCLVFLFQFRHVWFQSRTWGTAKNAYRYFTLLLPVLALATVAGNFYCTGYLNYWFNEFVDYFGYWIYAPLAWAFLECGMQWKWLWWFYSFEQRYRGKFEEAPAGSNDTKAKVVEVADQAWWLPSWRFKALQVLIVIWTLSAVATAWRHLDVQALATLLCLA